MKKKTKLAPNDLSSVIRDITKMEKLNKFSTFQNNPDFFDIVISSIEKELFNMKKLVNNITQLRGKSNKKKLLKKI